MCKIHMRVREPLPVKCGKYIKIITWLISFQANALIFVIFQFMKMPDFLISKLQYLTIQIYVSES